MEKRINEKVDTYITELKNNIKGWVEKNDTIDFESKSSLLKFVFDFENIQLTKDDFTKRKRIKSIVPQYLRCTAKRANGEQCTRKKKDDSCYCGTHDKNRPHGIIDFKQNQHVSLKKLEVWLQEINGILYYIDNYNNIYKTQDILTNIINPDVIGRYKIIDSVYIME